MDKVIKKWYKSYMKDTEKRIEIRHKALQLFKENGYDAVTVNEIAAAANISKNTFYYYYKTKDDLLKELMSPAYLNLEGVMGELLAIPEPVDQLLFLIEKMCDFIEGLGREIIKKSMILDITGGFENMRVKGHEPSEKQRQAFLMMKAIMERSMEKGQIRNDLEMKEVHHIMISMFIGCMHIWSNNEKMPSLKEEYMKMVKHTLLIKDR